MSLLRRIYSSNVLIKKIGVKERFSGCVDAVTCARVRGWVVDHRDPNRVLRVAVLIDEIVVGAADAFLPRPDVKSAGFPSALCGFDIEIDILPKDFLRGQLSVVVLDRGRVAHQLHISDPLLHMPGKSKVVTELAHDRSKTGDSVLVEGPLKGDYSIAIVNRSFARALINSGHCIRVTSVGEDLSEDPFFNRDAQVKGAYDAAPNSAAFSIHTLNTWPPETGHMRAPFKALHCYAWEESEFPPDFVDQFNQDLQLVCVTSQYTKQVLENSGVEPPIVVTGNGIDHMLNRSPRPLRRGDKFRFLHISSCFPRKGADILVRAFVEEFGHASDVELIIKTFENPHNEIEHQLRDLGNGVVPSNIHVIKANLSAEALYELYLNADCLVAPSRGEGFLLPAAEAMALNVPVIVTDAGGQSDFCDLRTSWLVRSSTAPAKTHMGLANSFWFEPDPGSLKKQMRAVYDASIDELHAKTTAARKRVLSHYTWEKVAERFMRAVQDRKLQLSRPAKKFRVALVSTWNQECGIATYSHNLAANAPDDLEIVVVSEDTGAIIHDAINVERIWTRDAAGIRRICDFINRSMFDAVFIQHHVAQFSFRDLGSMLDAITQEVGRRSVFLQLHSTQGNEAAMTEVAVSLAKLSGLFVHTLADVHALPRLAQSVRVAVVPHGITDLSRVRSEQSEQRERELFHVGAFGFCMPHKGIIEHIIALGMLRDKIPNLKATLLHSITGEEKTINYAMEVLDLIAKFGLQNVVEIDFRFLPMDEVIGRLASCDLIVFPYRPNAESASGAIREVAGLQKPMLCTPISTFEDMGDICFSTLGFEAFDIADAIYALYLDPTKLASKTAAQRDYVAKHSWKMTSERIFNIVRAELRDA